ncbi:MAG: FkbM family methyltransferase [Chloroflexota bacterium]
MEQDKPTNPTINPPLKYFEHLNRAAYLNNNLQVPITARSSPVPLVGPLIDRLRAKAHELVVYYVNQYATRQADVNLHLLLMAAALPQSTTGSAEPPATLDPSRHLESGSSAENQVTMMDVEAGYRLLLDREMDEETWNYWQAHLKKHYITRGYLVDHFLTTPEFRAAQAARNAPRLVQLPDFQIYVRLNDNFIGATIERWKQYEPNVSRVVSGLLSPGATFIDVGANIGYFSLLGASRVGRTGKVFSFEPNPANCDLLRMSAAANGFEDVISVHTAAVAEQKGQLQFTTPGIDSNGRVVNPAEAERGTVDTWTVEAVTLDEVLADCRRVDVIKIDVEGAEARVWRGMQETIRRHKPVITFEFSPGLLRHTSEVDPAEFLREVQSVYDLYIILPTGETASAPDAIADIMKTHEDSGLSHLDILAKPRR